MIKCEDTFLENRIPEINDNLIKRKTAYEFLSEYFHIKTPLECYALAEALNKIPSAVKDLEYGHLDIDDILETW